ncbi:hypothetical protein GCM10022421_21970 [Oceanisphaera sediminis]|uniref:Chemotaxis protein n=1 Tax=Oceanisphaera sediminis TaxID=981381 RepID=A0ABP7E6T8_9GAMM
MIELLTAASLSLCLTDIKQDAHQLMKVGNQVVGAAGSFVQATPSTLSVQQTLADDVVKAARDLQTKLSTLASRVAEMEDIDESELDAALELVSSATLQFAGQVEYIQTELELNTAPEATVADRTVLTSIVRVRNTFEDLFVLLKQFKEDEPLESGALFASRDEALAVSVKGLMALGLSDYEARELVH